MNKVLTYEEILKQMKIQLHLTGIPFHKPANLPRFLIIFTILLLALVQQLSFFWSRISPKNILELAQLFPCTATGILSALKILPIFFKREKIYALCDCIENLYDILKTKSEMMNRFNKYILFTKTLVKFYIILNLILISIYTFSSLIFVIYELAVNKELNFQLPFAILLPFRVDNWFNWAVIYLELIIAGFVCVLFYTTVDCLFFILITQMCINFKVLCHELESYKNDQCDKLNKLIKEHQYLIHLCNDLEDIFTGPNFYNLIIGALSICAIGFNLTTGDWTDIPGSIFFLASVLLQILMINVYGENLYCESQKVGDALYHCKWYEMDVKTRKTILFMIVRANRGQRLTAYKFSDISYASFTSIIRASWSYFTILRTVFNPSEIHEDIDL